MFIVREQEKLPDSVIRTATDHQSITILETGDSPFVAIQSAHKFTCTRIPDFDTSISWGRHDVLLVKINYIHGCPMAH